MSEYMNYIDDLRKKKGMSWDDMYKKYGSPRFGGLAYLAPPHSHPDIGSLSRYEEVTPQKIANNLYKVNYDRTGRNMGTYQTYTTGLSSGDHIHARIADTILDNAKELNRIDPNFYVYNLQSKEQNRTAYTPQITARPQQTTQAQPVIAPYGQGTLQKQGPASADAFMQAFQNLMGGV